MVVAISIAVFTSYILFYTMYSKQEKKLVPQSLVQLFTMQRGLNTFLIEMNKAISLSGITCLMLAFIPYIIGSEVQQDMLMSAFVQIVVHVCFSIYWYYGTHYIPPLEYHFGLETKYKPNNVTKYRLISVYSAAVADLAALVWLFDVLSWSAMGFGCILFSIVHFFFMEIDHKWVL